MAKEVNPRRQALRVLRAMKSNLSVMVDRWNQRQTTYDQATGWTKLAEADKAENSIDEWQMLYKYMSVVSEQAEAIKRFAARNIDELREKQEMGVETE